MQQEKRLQKDITIVKGKNVRVKKGYVLVDATKNYPSIMTLDFAQTVMLVKEQLIKC